MGRMSHIAHTNKCAVPLQLLLDAGANVEGAAVRNGQESTADSPLQLASAAGGHPPPHTHRHTLDILPVGLQYVWV